MPDVEVLHVYDGATLQRFAEAVERECERLRGLITDAHRRLREAEAAVQRSAALHERVGAMVLDAHAQVAEERRALEQTLGALTESAETEAARVIAAARDRAGSFQQALGRLRDDGVADAAPRGALT